MAPLELLVLLLVIVVVVVLLLRRSTGTGLRGPRKRHVVTRIVCGVLGFGILIAVGVGSWQEMNKPYAAGKRELMVKVPTNEPPAPDAKNGGRFLHYVVVVDASAGVVRPVHAEMIEFKLPEDIGREFRADFSLAGEDMGYTTSPREMRYVSVPGASNRLAINVRESLGSEEAHGGTSRSGNSPTYVVGKVRQMMTSSHSGGMPDSPLAVVPSSPTELRVYGLMLQASKDDSLEPVPLAEFARRHGPEIDVKPGRYGPRPRPLRHKSDVPAHGAALAVHVGPVAMLLVAAAFLLTQLFTRRHVAFPAVLAAMVLYVAVLDRVALGVNLSYAEDKDAPIAVRLLGYARAHDTFFYQETATESLQALADDLDAPRQLRESAIREFWRAFMSEMHPPSGAPSPSVLAKYCDPDWVKRFGSQLEGLPLDGQHGLLSISREQMGGQNSGTSFSCR